MSFTNSKHQLLTATLAVLGLLLICPATATECGRYWVFFRDKNVPAGKASQALNETAHKLTPAALERRRLNMPVLVDEYDLPVSVHYIEQVKSTGAHLRQSSRWLNAVSVEATSAQIESIENLACVLKAEAFRLRAVRAPLPNREALDDLHYGNSYTQDELCHIPELHNRGLSGHGILMCILDTGAWLVHDAFDSLHVVAMYDFVNHDSIVANEPGQDTPDQHMHGTATLSAMAGYKDSVLIGPAYGADVLVAKTEWVAGEVHSEEDNYVAGLEWADSMGARITTSSLGYIGPDTAFWYSFDELDGHTAVTTRGVEIAASRGILCVTAAGNENGSDWDHIVTPADADSILAVGAVSNEGSIVGFSSRGPSGDGRIKPDVCAMGADVFCARADSNDYWILSGTSLATPVVAGIAALIMEAHPDWTAQMVRTAIMNTASNHETPDNDYGWGIVDAVGAADYVFDDAYDSPRGVPASHVLISSYPNPVNGVVTIQLTLPMESAGKLTLFDTLGREVNVWSRERWNAGTNSVEFETSGLATGTYVASFAGEKGHAVQKIVVVK
jgi:hypothetical protein